MGSRVYLYVHSRFAPGEVVAFCEGAIGAMVAARCGLRVAAIKGMRNYRRPPVGREDGYSVLPELEGVDFGGREVLYIPDLDVKPETRAEAMAEVPKACQWLIERQGGRAKVVLLHRETGVGEDGSRGAKDLDEWLLSLDDGERVEKFRELLEGAIGIEEWVTEEESGEEQEELVVEGQAGDEPPRHIPVSVAAESNEDAEEDREAVSDQELVSGSRGTNPGSAGVEESFQRKNTRRGSTEPAPAGDGVDLQTHLQSMDALQGPFPVESPAEGSVTKNRDGEGSETTEGRGEDPSNGGDGGTEKEQEREPGAQGETASRNSPAVHRMRRASPGMEWWYATRNLSEEKVEKIRAATEYYNRVSQAAPRRRRSAPVHVPKWNAGEVFIAIVVAVFVAGAVCMLVYLARQQEGLLGSVGEIATLPVWWIQAALYWTVGALVAEVVARTRHRKRRRQLREHLRGGAR